MVIRNCWYMVAWDHEIPADGLFHRTVIDASHCCCFTRATAAWWPLKTAAATGCPLHKGRKAGDCVRCGYHGPMFNAQGQCVEAQGLDILPPKARVRS